MNSVLVVTSWWSNCLGLTAIDWLQRHVPNRRVLVMQAGKSEEQKVRFRRFLPAGVEEIPYPFYVLPDDSAMREYLAKDVLRDEEGAWFVDHDAFITEPSAAWFKEADRRFESVGICLCTPPYRPGGGVTAPAYWLSPRRWPSGLSSFAPIPFETKPSSLRPDLHRCDGRPVQPRKDTLVQVLEELTRMGLAGTFPTNDEEDLDTFLSSFPSHLHLGGLHLLTGPAQAREGLPSSYYDWRRETLLSFDAFFRNCPEKILEIEEPELLRRHQEMMRTLSI